MLELRGRITIKGPCSIGNASCITTGSDSRLEFGSGFVATAALRLVCYHSVSFAERVTAGWDCMIMDTDFHRLTRDDGKPVTAYAPIHIGACNWFGNGCLTMKGTRTPAKTTVAARTVLHKDYSHLPERCIIGQRSTTEILREGIWRNPDDDRIDYEVADEQM